MRFIAYNAVSIISVIGAISMMYFEKPGWGWLVFIAVILAVIPSDKDDDKNG